MKNKRGQDLSIGTLILIVLGVIVLVLLILGFSIGWSNLWEKINIFGGSSSVGDVVTACNLAVNSQNTYDYCQNFRQIKVDGKTEYLNCDDGRVSGQLNSKINCGQDYRLEQCNKLKETQGSSFNANTKVNNVACGSVQGFETATASCNGNAFSCGVISDLADCNKQKTVNGNCEWSTSTNTCNGAGTTAECKTFTTQPNCIEQNGCIWN